MATATKGSALYRYDFDGFDGTAWTIRAGTLEHARTAAYRAEKRRTGSVAAAAIAAATLRRA